MSDPLLPSGSQSSSASLDEHLSIGEVLALLLEEFPDVTISKIRFLESQGLIDPERTASGYRKFYTDDVELLRCILRQQRENYLPLRVIKDRIDSGQIDPTGERPRPLDVGPGRDSTDGIRRAGHPSAGRMDTLTGEKVASAAPRGDVGASAPDPAPLGEALLSASQEPAPVTRASTTAAMSGLLLDANELCAMAGLTRAQLADLVTYGVITGESNRPEGPYDEDAAEIAAVCKRFLDAGVEPRHLRGWRVAADREAGLLEQLVQPLLLQRSPEGRAQAVAQFDELEQLGGRLRSALMRSALRQRRGR